MNQEVLQLHRQGLRPAKIAKKLGLERREVEAEIGRHEVKRTHRLMRLIIVLLALALPAGLLLADRHFKKAAADASDAEVAHNLQAVAGEYLSRHGQEHWLLKGDPEADIEQSMRLGLAEKGRLEAALADHRNIPEVAKLAELFGGRFRVAFFTDRYGGNSVSFHEAADVSAIAETFEVVLYAEAQRSHARIQDTFAKYDAEWGSLILGGIEMSKPWHDALVVHELEHARLDREGAASAHAQFLSDEWISEEVRAHLLERRVLDSAVKGGYEQALGRIVSGKKARTLAGLYASLRPQDLYDLDAVFPPASEREANIRNAQYYLDLGETWLRSAFPETELAARRIDNYRGLFRVTN